MRNSVPGVPRLRRTLLSVLFAIPLLNGCAMLPSITTFEGISVQVPGTFVAAPIENGISVTSVGSTTDLLIVKSSPEELATVVRIVSGKPGGSSPKKTVEPISTLGALKGTGSRLLWTDRAGQSWESVHLLVSVNGKYHRISASSFRNESRERRAFLAMIESLKIN